ncbi:AAA family ATPase, partial [Patescibacteria group bacterium]|nr:AAA family ATPase [Patescibacteria group bacterium]
METYNNISKLFVEKYRPKILDDLILPENYRKKLQEYIDDKNIPNLLFVGPAGSGKTSLARILTSKKGVLSSPSSNLLIANGSSKSARGIGFVDDIIEPFLKTMPFGNDKLRIVFIDECDYMTNDSFESQRGVIEKYEKQGRFLYTANYLSKIPEPVRSRFQIFTFDKIPINFVTKYCINILESENINFKKDDLDYVVKELYPDVRKIVNTLQKNSIDNKLIIGKD